METARIGPVVDLVNRSRPHPASVGNSLEVGATELTRATQIVAELESTGKEVVIFKKGKPVAVLRPWGEGD